MEILLFTGVKEAVRFLRKHGSKIVQVVVLAEIEKPQSLGGLRKNHDTLVATGLFMWAPLRSSAHGEHTSRGQANRGRREGSQGG